MSIRAYKHTRRFIDISASALGLCVTAPLQLIIAALVRANLGPPVLFRQIRAGQHGRSFTLIKFRTMHHPDPDAGRVTDAERLTRFGRALRSTSLDELPTLWNVLRGDMSLVGPRPLLPEYLPLYTPRQALRHDVPPGITGLAQVNGRNALDWNDRLELDVHYVNNRSLLLDIKILIRTATTVARRRGISAAGHATMDRFTGTDASGEAPTEGDRSAL